MVAVALLLRKLKVILVAVALLLRWVAVRRAIVIRVQLLLLQLRLWVRLRVRLVGLAALRWVALRWVVQLRVQLVGLVALRWVVQLLLRVLVRLVAMRRVDLLLVALR